MGVMRNAFNRQLPTNIIILKTYLVIAYRNFIRNKVFSLINVLGLAFGISSALVIFPIAHYDTVN